MFVVLLHVTIIATNLRKTYNACHSESTFFGEKNEVIDICRYSFKFFKYILIFSFQNAPVVQWLEYAVANGVARVRFSAGTISIYDALAEWLRRCPAKALCFAHEGSNPSGVGI